MPKADLELVKLCMQRNELDVRTVAQVLEDINAELSSQVDEDKPPTVKKQFVMLVSDPEGKLMGCDFTGWVLQIPEEDSPYTAEERLFRAAYEYNATKKGERLPVKTVGEACEFISAKHFKEQNVWVKTKEPVLIVRTSNKIPTDKPERLGAE